jgi:uroporphyrinogen-III synthase
MVSYTARTFSGAALARELGPALAGKQVLLPRSERAAPDLPNLITDAGAQVSQVIVYKTGGMTNLPRELSEAVRNGDFDVLTFFSPSAVENFRNEVGAEAFSRIAKTSVLAAIGPVTSTALRRHGVKAAIEPKQATAEAMAAAIAAYFERQEKKPGKS